ncbi:hypothetical protein PFISCL1PPCAC_23488, partial [Pristionchus fissidentatus]
LRTTTNSQMATIPSRGTPTLKASTRPKATQVDRTLSKGTQEDNTPANRKSYTSIDLNHNSNREILVVSPRLLCCCVDVVSERLSVITRVSASTFLAPFVSHGASLDKNYTLSVVSRLRKVSSGVVPPSLDDDYVLMM